MELYKSTDNGFIWKLDEDDKRRNLTGCDYMMSDGHHTIYGMEPRLMDGEMQRIKNIKRTTIY